MKSNIEVTAVVTDEAAAVEIQAEPKGGYDRVTATGYSKKHPNDTPNRDLAYNLAMARALEDLAAKFNRLAQAEQSSPAVFDPKALARLYYSDNVFFTGV